MENGKDSRVLLILNPVAGHKAARALLYPLVKLVCANEGMATVYATSARGEAERPRAPRLLCAAEIDLWRRVGYNDA